MASLDELYKMRKRLVWGRWGSVAFGVLSAYRSRPGPKGM